MALLKNGFMGDAIGKLGNVVFRKWNALITVSKYQPNVSNPNTQGQQIQRLKIKNLSLVLRPFLDNIIPLNFKNRRGSSTSWAEAVRVNFPLVDDEGNIPFKDMILSVSFLKSPVIVSATYDEFINQFKIKFDFVGEEPVASGLLRVSAVGKIMWDDSFNIANLLMLPDNKTFTSYIEEYQSPERQQNYTFDNAWAEGFFFYYLVRSRDTDYRSYSPRNLCISPSSAAYFTGKLSILNVDPRVNSRIIPPEYFYAEFKIVESNPFLRISINTYTNIPGLGANDTIFIYETKLSSQGTSAINQGNFLASVGEVLIPIQFGEELLPHIILYYVCDENMVQKSCVTRYIFALPYQRTYCETLFLYNYLLADTVKIRKPYTAIWGELKDFLPESILVGGSFYIYSICQSEIPVNPALSSATSSTVKTTTASGTTKLFTYPELQHVINDRKQFFCSNLLRNQLYTININDDYNTLYSFDVIGIDDDHEYTGEGTGGNRLIKFKVANDLAYKVS